MVPIHFLDEDSQFRYIEDFREHSTYSSTIFLRYVVNKFPYLIECVQTDNGAEFTNCLLPKGSDKPTLFKLELKNSVSATSSSAPAPHGTTTRRSAVITKIMRSFMPLHRFYNFEDFIAQLAVRGRSYNNFPMRPLSWRSSKQVLFAFSNV